MGAILKKKKRRGPNGDKTSSLQRLRWRFLALSMRPSGNPSVLKKGGAAETIASLVCMPLWANAKVDFKKRKNSELLKPNGPEITYSPIFVQKSCLATVGPALFFSPSPLCFHKPLLNNHLLRSMSTTSSGGSQWPPREPCAYICTSKWRFSK